MGFFLQHLHFILEVRLILPLTNNVFRRREAAVEPTKIRIRCTEEEWTRVDKKIREG